MCDLTHFRSDYVIFLVYYYRRPLNVANVGGESVKARDCAVPPSAWKLIDKPQASMGQTIPRFKKEKMQ